MNLAIGIFELSSIMDIFGVKLVQKETKDNSKVLVCRKKNQRAWIASIKGQKFKENNDRGP